MVVATNGILYKTTMTKDNTFKWICQYSRFDFNDIVVYCDKTPLNDMLNRTIGEIMLTRMAVMWRATTSGAGVTGTASIYQKFPGVQTLFSLLSLADWCQAEWKGCIPVSDWRTPETLYTGFFALPAATVTTNDDIIITFEGELWTEPADSSAVQPTPVSLEAYKWPLQKRR